MRNIQADRYASAILLRYPLHFPPDHTVHDGRAALDDSENLGAHVLIDTIGGWHLPGGRFCAWLLPYPLPAGSVLW
jgi:hypothetical protein